MSVYGNDKAFSQIFTYSPRKYISEITYEFIIQSQAHLQKSWTLHTPKINILVFKLHLQWDF